MTIADNGSGTPSTLGDIDGLGERLEQRIADECADLRAMLEAEQQLRTQLETMLATIAAREKRVRRALAALEDSSSERRPKAKTGKAWSVSDETVEKIYHAIVAAIEANDGQPTTLTEVRRVAGGAHETYRRAVDRLRADERVRVAGKTRGGGMLLALMPESADA